MKPEPSEVQRYAAAYRSAEERRVRNEEQAAAQVRAKLPELARMLRTEFGALDVGFFGSLRSGRLAAESDVDLFVDQVRRGGYFRALDRLQDVLQRPVDLVELSRAPEALRQRIAEDGVHIDA